MITTHKTNYTVFFCCLFFTFFLCYVPVVVIKAHIFSIALYFYFNVMFVLYFIHGIFFCCCFFFLGEYSRYTSISWYNSAGSGPNWADTVAPNFKWGRLVETVVVFRNTLECLDDASTQPNGTSKTSPRIYISYPIWRHGGMCKAATPCYTRICQEIKVTQLDIKMEKKNLFSPPDEMV